MSAKDNSSATETGRNQNVPPPHLSWSKQAFTLIELLVVMAIISFLAAMLLPALIKGRDASRTVVCDSNLRQLAFVYHMYSQDNKDHLPTAAMLGESCYRVVTDPIGIPGFFQSYSTTNQVWLCPAGRGMLRSNGVNYAWSLAQNVVGAAGDNNAFNTMSTTFVVYDNYPYMTPSVFNMSEYTVGPPVVNALGWYYPHSSRRKVNWLYLDGHVETKLGPGLQ